MTKSSPSYITNLLCQHRNEFSTDTSGIWHKPRPPRPVQCTPKPPTSDLCTASQHRRTNLTNELNHTTRFPDKRCKGTEHPVTKQARPTGTHSHSPGRRHYNLSDPIERHEYYSQFVALPSCSSGYHRSTFIHNRASLL
eukprot:TRINITY_DN67010_c7_g4_i1.p1 TRINITY_DN67010_c7_g4~~TRINITY_DN67010_c7_g4_i1.p1  ORF type:complete len:139 (+),score=4.76 TRINITY_DN67010_c7_g4_i1:27-443(+)